MLVKDGFRMDGKVEDLSRVRECSVSRKGEKETRVE